MSSTKHPYVVYEVFASIRDLDELADTLCCYMNVLKSKQKIKESFNENTEYGFNDCNYLVNEVITLDAAN